MKMTIKTALIAALTCFNWFYASPESMAQTSRKVYYVADERIDCQGVVQTQCLLVRENLKSNWILFSEQIVGFKYEEGTEYKIQVRIEKIKNPPADASNLRYILEKVLSKKRTKTPPITPAAPVFNGMWELEAFGNEPITLEKKVPRLELQNKRVAGLSGCNNFFAELEQKNGVYQFTNIGSTKKMCADMSIEQQFLGALRNTNQLQLRDDGKLILLKGEELLMIFRRK